MLRYLVVNGEVKMEIPVLDITDKTQDKIDNLSESGCLVVKNATSEDIREKVKTELEPAMKCLLQRPTILKPFILGILSE